MPLVQVILNSETLSSPPSSTREGGSVFCVCIAGIAQQQKGVRCHDDRNLPPSWSFQVPPSCRDRDSSGTGICLFPRHAELSGLGWKPRGSERVAAASFLVFSRASFISSWRRLSGRRWSFLRQRWALAIRSRRGWKAAGALLKSPTAFRKTRSPSCSSCALSRPSRSLRRTLSRHWLASRFATSCSRHFSGSSPERPFTLGLARASPRCLLVARPRRLASSGSRRSSAPSSPSLLSQRCQSRWNTFGRETSDGAD